MTPAVRSDRVGNLLRQISTKALLSPGVALGLLVGTACGSVASGESAGTATPQPAPTTQTPATPTTPAQPSYDIDRYTFDTDASPDRYGEVVVVVGSQSAEITSALQAASARFMMVDELGHESTNEVPATEGEDGLWLYSPNYVSDVTAEYGGLSFYVDCKGEIAPPMRDRFLEILVEELTRAGVTSARVFSPRGE